MYEAGIAVMFATGAFYTIRPLTQLIVSGVFERHPRLRLAITETGHQWVPQAIRYLDWLVGRSRRFRTRKKPACRDRPWRSCR